MKIQVGKTYSTAEGRQYYIECQLHNPLIDESWAGKYLGTHADGGYNIYNEDGSVCPRNGAWGSADLQFQLLPNKVEKWCAVNRNGLMQLETFNTEAEIKATYPHAIHYQQISWEEEE